MERGDIHSINDPGRDVDLVDLDYHQNRAGDSAHGRSFADIPIYGLKRVSS